MNRNRLLYGAGTGVVVVLGLASRHYASALPPFLALYAGDTLWAMVVFGVIGVLAPAWSSFRVATVALILSCAVETSQLYQAAWINAVRDTRAGGLVLGYGFLWSDILCYTAGVSLAVALERTRQVTRTQSTFGDAAARTSVRQRLERLTPNAPRKWGRMTPHQMVCHLTDGYRMSVGERTPAPVHNFFTRTVVKFVALHTPMTWPKGVKTVPEADQEQGGTKPAEWDRDLAELLRRVDAFTPVDGRNHSIFGPLTGSEWNVWAFRHADHHLRQFGL